MNREKSNKIGKIYNDRKFNLVYNLYNITSSTLNLNQLLPLIMEMTINNLKADVGNIILIDRENNPYSKVVLGLSLEIINQLEYKNTKLIDHIIQTEKALIINNYNEKYKKPKQLYIKSILCAPLKTKKRLIGLIFLINKNVDQNIVNFDKIDLDILNIIVKNIAFSIENAQLYEEVLDIKNFNTNIINSLSTGAITTDLQGTILSINDSAKFIFDLDSQALYIDRNIEEVLIDLNNKDYLLNAIKRKENLINIESTLRHKNGSEKILNVSISVLNNTNKEIIGFVFSILDITEKKVLEKQVLRNEQLAALGELSAGLAHEIKNPLTSIKGFSQILPNKLDDKDFLIKFSTIIKKEVERLNKIIEDLLQFSKPKGKKRENLDINHLIQDVVELMDYQIKKHHVKLKTKLKELPKVYCDVSQIKQVFINIILNALQAIDQKGEITIKNELLIRKSPENLYYEYIAVYINDSGKGITEKEREKMFNPFYTTKTKGTGLGLSITYRIVSNHKGFIEVFSEEKIGTTFIIYMPTINNWTE